MTRHKYTERERFVDSSTVPDSEIIALAEIMAKHYAGHYRWRDGWRDLLPVLWEIYHKLRARGVPVCSWPRAVACDMIDAYRALTGFRRKEPLHTTQFPESGAGFDSLASDCVQTMDFMVHARRETPDTFARAITPYEDIYIQLTGRQKTIVLHLFHGLTMKEVGEAMGISESRVSQLVAEITEITGGKYEQGYITTDASIARIEVNTGRARKKIEIPAEGVDVSPIRDYDSYTGSNSPPES